MSSTDNYRLFQVVNLLAIIFTIVMNSLANILLFFGVNTGEVSDSFPSFFTPRGETFGIWAIIYTLQIVFLIYQSRPSQKSESYLKDIGFFYAIAAVFNVGWLLLFHYAGGVDPNMLAATNILIILFLVGLLVTYLRLQIGLKEVSRNVKLAVHIPLSVYLGWISVATVANIASTINYLVPGIDAGIQQIASAALIMVALLLGILMIVRRRDFAYGLVIAWAAGGIALKWPAIPVIFYAGMIAIAVIIILILILPFIKKKNFVDFYMVRGSE
jgi:hypothetical protein